MQTRITNKPMSLKPQNSDIIHLIPKLKIHHLMRHSSVSSSAITKYLKTNSPVLSPVVPRVIELSDDIKRSFNIRTWKFWL